MQVCIIFQAPPVELFTCLDILPKTQSLIYFQKEIQVTPVGRS